MSGRYEHQTQINKVTKEGLAGYPDIIHEYYKKSAGLQASSRQVFVNNAKRFVDYLKARGVDVNGEWYKDITPDDISEYLDFIKVKKLRCGREKIMSDVSLKNVWAALNNFFDFLKRKHYIDVNPAEEMKDELPNYRDIKKVVYMTVEEVEEVKQKIINESKMPNRDLCIFMLGCRTGMRSSAITEIDISDIDFENMVITVVEKGNVHKDVIIDPDTIQLINNCIEERGDVPGEDALFLRKRPHHTQRINAWDMRQILEKYTIDLNKRITPHKMRSTCATNLYIQTGDIYIVADRLGHRNIENTRRYTDTVDKSRNAAKIMGNLF